MKEKRKPPPPMIDANGTNDNARPCAPRSRCRRWRVCPHCARIRQAQIGDLADQLQAKLGALEWSVLHPSAKGAEAVAALRAAWMRKARPAGALWTIEQGAAPGALHLNIIHPLGAHAAAGQASTWCEPVRTTPRTVAAYISKPRGAPDQAVYPGRVFGRSGPLWQWLLEQPDAPMVQAATVQTIIAPHAPEVLAALNHSHHNQGNQMVEEDPVKTAARWLPAFRGLLTNDPTAPPVPPPPPPPKPKARHLYEGDGTRYVAHYPPVENADPSPRTVAQAAETSGPHLDALRAILATSARLSR